MVKKGWIRIGTTDRFYPLVTDGFARDPLIELGDGAVILAAATFGFEVLEHLHHDAGQRNRRADTVRSFDGVVEILDVQIDAETDCDLLLLPAVPFSRLMKNNIYLENFIYKRTTEHFSDVIAGIERTFFMTLPQRIAAFLLDEAADTSSDEPTLTQEAIARSIGSAREAVSRSLKKMNKDGSIQISRGSIRILDKSRLYEMMNTF